ncbi:competence type IV pilus major pilin ComGC [Carnobacterium pleistocenium]|uniref:competence type IV pilus major pilin ComGC n=1 Tax=Carnobacterium pleistocenium TaxID=181073 RepID=UPI00054EB5D4|nr:competence type IV pilus major pilin ComGC [Carnobacterium pleistocenium]
MKNRKPLNQKGFTLIEMVMVLFIISVLMLLIVPNVVKQKDSIDAQGTEALVTVIQTQVELYELEGEDGAVSLDALQQQGYLSAKQVKQASAKAIIITNGIVSSSQN